tara:strand:+ start:104 stop:754 length:651 start_codon:yes stop_codon:yes gene_type:complete
MNLTPSVEYSFDKFKNLPEIKHVDAIIKQTREPLEGNCLYQHHRDFKHAMHKIKLCSNIFKLCKRAKNILEVGFNAGHSVILYLHSNPSINILSFDICSHSYSEPCANYIKSLSNTKFTLVKGDSTTTLLHYNTCEVFDLIHIDGGHDINIAESDLVNCKRFSFDNTLVIFDDANDPHIKSLLNRCIEEKFIIEIDYKNLGLHKIPEQRIFRYCNP